MIPTTNIEILRILTPLKQVAQYPLNNRWKFEVINNTTYCTGRLEKERQICEVDRYLHSQLSHNGLLIMAGDFNGGMNSSVHRYLVGEQSINGCEANPYWDELVTGYSAISGEPIKATLDTITNPRWAGGKSAYPPTVTDRIYTLEYQYEFSLESLHLFGTVISPKNGLAPSDHYGVVAEIEFDEY